MRSCLLMLALLGLLCGCNTVRPWQKKVLSGAPMRFAQEGETLHFIDHALTTLEQAEGGSGGAGGGCGCR